MATGHTFGMEQIVSFLIDSNLIIYHLSGSVEASAFIRKNAETVAISAVTRIEVLGFPFPSHEAERNATDLINVLLTYQISPKIVEATILLRKQSRIKIPDALIAATALCHQLTLVTRNVHDFERIPDLMTINPFK
jgi:predicted nucleic acid-binding protein